MVDGKIRAGSETGAVAGLGPLPPLVTLVRGPIVSELGSINNEAVPALGLAYIAAYLEGHG